MWSGCICHLLQPWDCKFVFLLCIICLEIIRLFQFLYSRETSKKVHENPLEWKTLFKFLAYMNPIMIICRLLNCSLNFYVYKFLRHRNKKAEIRRRQKRQQDREMVHLRTANTIDTSNVQTA